MHVSGRYITGNSQMNSTHGPLKVGQFTVTIDGVEISGWQSIQIPASETEIEEEGDKKLWGQTTFDDLEMVRSVNADETILFDWREQVRAGKVEASRKTVVVTLEDEETSEPQIEWVFDNAWVREYVPPTLDTRTDGAIATEQAIVEFETIDRTNLSSNG